MGGALRVPVEFFARPGIRGLSGVTASIRKLNSTVNSIFYGAIFLGLQHSLMRAARGFIALNTEIENAQVGIAGLLTGLTGAPIATTMKVARQEVAYFRREAAKLPGDLPDYIQAFQLVAGPAFRAGATRDEARRLARLSVLAGSLTPTGRGMKTLPIDVLQALAGSAHQTNTRDLLTLLGMDAKAFNKLSQPERLKTLLEGLGRLEPAAVVAGFTWDAQFATLQDTIKQILRTLSGPMFSAAKRGLISLNDILDRNFKKWEFFLAHVGTDLVYWTQSAGRAIAKFDFAGWTKAAFKGGSLMFGMATGVGIAGLVASGIGGVLGTLIGASAGTMMAGPAGTVAGGFAGSAIGSLISLSVFTQLAPVLTTFFGALYQAAASFLTKFPGHVVLLVYSIGSALWELGRSIYYMFSIVADNPVTFAVMLGVIDLTIGALLTLADTLRTFADTARTVHTVLNVLTGGLERRWGAGRTVAGALMLPFVSPFGAALLATRRDYGNASSKQVDKLRWERVFGKGPRMSPFTGILDEEGNVDFQKFLDFLSGVGDTNINGPVTIQITAERLDNPDLVARSFQEAMEYLRDFRQSGRSVFFPRSN